MQFGYSPSGTIAPSWCEQLLPVTHFWDCSHTHAAERVVFVKPSGQLALGFIVGVESTPTHQAETLWKVCRLNSYFFVTCENIRKIPSRYYYRSEIEVISCYQS